MAHKATNEEALLLAIWRQMSPEAKQETMNLLESELTKLNLTVPMKPTAEAV